MDCLKQYTLNYLTLQLLMALCHPTNILFFPLFLPPKQGGFVSAPNDNDQVNPETKRFLVCLQCEVSAAKIAQQAELISRLQAQIAAQQQELSSRDAMAWLRY